MHLLFDERTDLGQAVLAVDFAICLAREPMFLVTFLRDDGFLLRFALTWLFGHLEHRRCIPVNTWTISIQNHFACRSQIIKLTPPPRETLPRLLF